MVSNGKQARQQRLFHLEEQRAFVLADDNRQVLLYEDVALFWAEKTSALLRTLFWFVSFLFFFRRTLLLRLS